MENLFTRQASSLVEHQRNWQRWQAEPFGQALSAYESGILTPLLKRKLGLRLLQLSIGGGQPLFSECAIPYQIYGQVAGSASPQASAFNGPEKQTQLSLDPDFLPFASNSFDVIILHHLLECSKQPHQVLREAHRTLNSSGQLILFAYNPWSLMGLRRLLSLQGLAPWGGHFRSQSKLQDWLQLLGFQIEQTEYGFYRLPFNVKKAAEDQQSIERWGEKYHCAFGCIYVIVARKYTAGMMPLHEIKEKRRVLAFPLAKPTISG